MQIHVDIVSTEREIFSGSVEMVFAPAVMGELGIAPRHAPLITRLSPGEVRLKLPDGKEESFYVSGGMLEVQPHVVTIMADTALRADEIDEAAVQKAKDEAEAQLAGAKTGEIDYKAIQAQLAEASAQLQLIKKLRR